MGAIKLAIAEDNTAIRNILLMNLVKNERIDIQIASENGKSLLRKLSRNSVDIILLDINMPIMDGFETIKHLQSKYPNIKIIMFSSEPRDEVLEHFLTHGAERFLPKESSIEHITMTILEVHDDSCFPEW